MGSWNRQYKGGKGNDRGHWLSIWSSELVVCNRVSRDPVVIEHPFVSVMGGIQPDALPDILSGREDGLDARFLFSYPTPIPNHGWNEDPIEGSTEYQEICDTLWNLNWSFDPLTLSPKAKGLFIDWYDSHVQESPPDNLRPTWAKAEGYCGRIALILFLTRQACRETNAIEVDEQSMAGAIQLIEYFKSHAIRVYDHVADLFGNDRTTKALALIQRRGGTVTAREFRQYLPTKTSDEAAELLEYLAEKGCGTVTRKPRNSLEFTLNDSTLRNDEPPKQRSTAKKMRKK